MIKGRTQLFNEAKGTMLLCCLIMNSNSIALMFVTRTTTLGQAELFQQLYMDYHDICYRHSWSPQDGS